MKTITGSTWNATLTDEEYAAWDVYAERHHCLLAASYILTLEMFLAHFRRGVNLNEPLTP